MDLRGYLKVLARRWPTVMVCLLLGIGAGQAANELIRPVYEARTQLFVATRTGADTAELNQGQSFSQARVQSYAAIVATRQVTEPVQRELGLPTTPEKLASQISADVPLNTVLINITVRDASPSRAARIANAVAVRFSAVVEQLETPKQTAEPVPAPPADGQVPDAASPPAAVSPVSLGITEKATAPSAPVSPRHLLNLAAGLLGGLLLGAAFVALRETLDTTLKTSEALSQLTSLPVLGSIPFDKDATKQPLATGAAKHSTRAEAFRKLRTNLQFAQVDDRPRVIVVTSPVPAEGKTNTAANLALSLAEAGIVTCLVDADLRRPCVARTFGLVQNAGLTTVLIGQARIEEVLQQAGSRLSVLTSGAVPPNPTELLSSDRMGELLRELAGRYEAVIVDTAPLLPVADTVGLAPLAQGALLVVRASKTGREQVRTAAESLSQVGVRTLGTVFSMAPLDKGKGYGNYGNYSDLPAPRPSARRKEAAEPALTHLAGEK
ncbi:polysaccharide biosynthesis tyrosine autokinase [Streptomyces sp. PSKA54]|uniref:non-specific protein-tyrosine kinase n=1 Tax=Streptomyces himalayensis subsp. aureolus TaxID=2758039 RepID=A0A7W2CXL1_9ACTN|nr:polysaccharide biosynthesis tyrosine autokinase [Streptomyces himalayensis]MBA4860946.1 polysaccharide biosynthesis tyrosine autokinase [Streptomyces himalayensis subsp. aureolus]